jgi:hypothetical protein
LARFLGAGMEFSELKRSASWLRSTTTDWGCPVSCLTNKNLAKRAAENYTLVHYFCRFFAPRENAGFGPTDVEKIGAKALVNDQVARVRKCLARLRRRATLRRQRTGF